MDAEELVETIVKCLVDNEKAVEVTNMSSAQVTVIEVRTAQDDMGKVVGKSGKTASAIRTILGCVGAKNDRRYVLQLID